jgi:hypothetical protein
VDRLYDPIYALFAHNDHPRPAWKFYDFCVPGKGQSGKKLTEIFDPLPEPATCFGSNFDMLLDTTKDIHVDYEHVIMDGVSRDRFPSELLAHHVSKGFKWQDYTLWGKHFLGRLSFQSAIFLLLLERQAVLGRSYSLGYFLPGI